VTAPQASRRSRREVERRLRSELREHAAPGELAAGRRSWAVVEAALVERAPVARRRRRPLLRLALVTALLAAGLAAALTSAGAEVGEWIEERIGLGPEETQPTLRGFPGSGRLLAVSDSGAWVVNPGGGMRRLGAYSEVGWSPNGLFVVGTRGHRITAVEPDGEPRWSLARPGRLSDPAWSPGDGFRVAYLERTARGRSLRVLDGSGRLDHHVATGVARVRPAWRPGRGYVVTFAAAGAPALLTVDADSGRRLWSARTGAAPLELSWTRDGRRLVALLPRELRVYGRDGRLLAERRLPAGSRALTMAVHPGGGRAAVALTRSKVSSVLSFRLRGAAGRQRELFTGSGTFSDLAWSPGGQRLLVGWPEANQWLLVGARRPRAFAGVSRQLDPAASGAGFPRLAGWCCPR
jgi:hypothetical protein